MLDIRCVFMGTPQIAATVLSSMLEAGIKIDLVVSQPDKKVGRKQKIVYSPVKQVAVEHEIECFQPVRIKEDHQRILDLKPDLIVTCAYGQIIPEDLLNAPRFGCVNLHGSILPKYRGGAPIQRAIWNGDKESGMSLMKMAKRMDAGPVLAIEKVKIESQDNSTSVFEKMGLAASKLILDNFELICSGQAHYVEQDEDKVVFAPVITKQEEKIDFSKDDIEILNQIRALSFTPGAYGLIKNKKLKLLEATYQKETVKQPQEILGLRDNSFAISLHEGILLVSKLQMEGKPVMQAKDFFNGQGRNMVGQIIE